MQLDTAFETVPEDDELLYSIEHWDAERISQIGERVSESTVEAFVHPRTGTAARIIEGSEGTYSVQPSMGDFGPFDNVVQPDDPASFVSGSASVVMLELETLSEARAIAYAWLRGWVQRNGSVGGGEGSVIDSER